MLKEKRRKNKTTVLDLSAKLVILLDKKMKDVFMCFVLFVGGEREKERERERESTYGAKKIIHFFLIITNSSHKAIHLARRQRQIFFYKQSRGGHS